MNTEQERSAFEAWANGRCELHLVNPAGRYSSAITQFAWEAYQAGRSALEAAREDAERYRWLKKSAFCNVWEGGDGIALVVPRAAMADIDSRIDAAIDAAMEKEKGNG